eukprot:541476_1
MGNAAPERFHDEGEPGWSAPYGGGGGQMFQSMSNNHKITGVALYDGGMDQRGRISAGITFKVGDHWKERIGHDGINSRKQALYLHKNEYINKVKVGSTYFIHGIEIITNKGRSISVGCWRASQTNFEHSDGGGNKALIDCRGRTGGGLHNVGWIDQIQFKWAEPDAETLREIQNEKRIKREREEAEQKERERQKAIANMQQQQQTMNNQRTQIMKMSKKKARQKNKNNEKLLDITNNKLKQNELD